MNTKSILITGARSFFALDLAHMFFDAGMKVVCADCMKSSVCRFSRKVNRFYKIASPALKFELFVTDLQRIIEEEQIDCIIPTCEEVFYLGKAKDRLKASVFCETFERLEVLHNKWKFYNLLCKLKFDTPETHLWKGKKRDNKKWIIKPIYSRFAARIQVVEEEWPHWEENPSNPLIIQKYIHGKKLCSYSICHKGKITAHGAYKILHSMRIGSAICFETVQVPEVDDFVKRFAKETGFTGQIAFDFIQSDRLYCIECNPRATSGIHLFERNTALTKCFFNEKTFLTPKIGNIFHEHLFMLWFGIKQKEIFSKRFWRHFVKGKNPLWVKGNTQVLLAFPMILLDIATLTLFQRRGFHEAMSLGLEYNG